MLIFYEPNKINNEKSAILREIRDISACLKNINSKYTKCISRQCKNFSFLLTFWFEAPVLPRTVIIFMYSFVGHPKNTLFK